MDKRKGSIRVKAEKDRTKDSHDLQAKEKADASETLEKVKEEKSGEEKVETDTNSENSDHTKDKGDIHKLLQN